MLHSELIGVCSEFHTQQELLSFKRAGTLETCSQWFPKGCGFSVKVALNYWTSNYIEIHSSFLLFILEKIKVKVTLVQVLKLCTGRTAQRGSTGIALLFHDQRHWKGMRGQRQAPAALYPPWKTRYPLYRWLGGPKGRSGQVRKISPSPGFDPRSVQPVDSHYTYWATRPTHFRRQR